MKQIQLSPKVRFIFSERSDGNIDLRFSNKSQVSNNLKQICRASNIKQNAIVKMEQVHKTNVMRVGKAHRGLIIPDSDGLVTNDPEVVLMLRLADCIPVVLFDPLNRAIGLVHSGWKGTVGKIALVAVEKMRVEFNTKPEDLLLILGPSILPCCNILKNPLQLELPEWKPFLKKKKEGFAVDLPAFVVETAIKAGIRKANIEISKTCTLMEDNLFSYRRAKDTGEKEGRFAILTGLKT